MKTDSNSIDSTYTILDFPSPIAAGAEMSIEEFLNIETFPLNRDVINRARSTVLLLEKPIPLHNEVSIMKYSGESCTYPAKFVKDQFYVLNGNTRQYIWNTYLNGGCINNKVKSLPIPSKIIYNLYEINNAEDAYIVYDSIDSDEAVEKTPDKISGVFRALNILDSLENSKIRKGNISTALDIACPFSAAKKGYRVPNVANLVDQVSVLIDVITVFDKTPAVGKGSLELQHSMGVALLAGKVMGVNSRWEDAIIRLGENTEDEHTKIEITDFTDPIDWLNYGAHSNPFKKPFKKGPLDEILPYKLARAHAIDYLAFCWLKYIANEEILHLPTEKELNNSHIKLLQLTWD